MLTALTLALLLTAQAAPEQALQEIQRSHIEANVPGPADFDRFLLRDLGAYFAKARNQKAVPVTYELLREGPTQTGFSYPKFYVWVRVNGGKSPDDRGAVRLEAIDREHFEVTNFVSENAIKNDKSVNL
jgi:hypothetical protein